MQGEVLCELLGKKGLPVGWNGELLSRTQAVILGLELTLRVKAMCLAEIEALCCTPETDIICQL